MFIGVELKELKKIKEHLQSELEDKNLPGQRKEEVLSCLYYLDCWIKEKRPKQIEIFKKYEV